MIRLQATISNGTRKASKTKKLYPAATPKASSTNRPDKRMKGLEIGRYVTISAMPTRPTLAPDANSGELFQDFGLLPAPWDCILGTSVFHAVDRWREEGLLENYPALEWFTHSHASSGARGKATYRW